MSDLKKIAALFILCLILAVYAKMLGIFPAKVGLDSNEGGNVLGAQTMIPSFANLIKR